MMTDYPAVLAVLHPDAMWTLDGDSYEGLTWLSDTSKPSKAELDKAWKQVKAARDKQAVQQRRAERYRAETDPLFFKAQRGEDDVTLEAWQAAVDQIRADLPYPS